MMDPVSQICEELKVSREEALYYLEGFNWELKPAIEACRSKTLPPIRAKSSNAPPPPPSTLRPSTPPRSTPQVLNKSRRIQPGIESPAQIPQKIQPISQISPEKQEELVASFREFTGSGSIEEAVDVLRYFNWVLDTAVVRYLDGFVVPPPNLNISLDDLVPLSGLVDTNVDWSALNKFADSLTSPSSSEDGAIPVNILSEASSQEQESESNKEKLIKSFLQVKVGLDRGEAITYLNLSNWDLQDAIDLALTEGISNEIDAAAKLQSQASPPSSMEAYPAKKKTQLKAEDIPQMASLQETTSPDNSEEESLIRSFYELASGATRKDAVTCLKVCNWDLTQALNFYMDDHVSDEISAAPNMSFRGLPLQSKSHSSTKKEKPLKEAGAKHISVDTPQITSLHESMGKTLSEQVSQLKDEKCIRAFLIEFSGATREQAISCLDHCDWDIGQAKDFFKNGGLSEALDMSMGLPPRSESQAKLDFTCFTETEAAPEDYGEEDVTVANPGTPPSQVDGKAVEEDSDRSTALGAKTAQTATITLTIVLADDGSGTEIEIPFRPDQTIRDIREAIEEWTSNKDSNYYLQSFTGEDYTDRHLNTTVQRLKNVESTTLFQLFRG